ncbi:uncharacterized protein RSE6_04588 [Rhynchosporium secalis]|uniref:Uncharacterized protein n=1 Tax=Rhynchosporium secalis TaxID=38038 RepID=A0A1E1M705_RHYSE|nr:uncharacterized protein RSE6_04588 [Rhynchosporium secalis]
MHGLFLCLCIFEIFEFCSAKIDLGAAGPYGILGRLSVTNTRSTIINGDLGTGGTSLTGFPPGIVSGNISRGDTTITAFSDANTAYVTVAASSSSLDLSGINLGGLKLPPGSYKFASSAELTGTLTLDRNGDLDGEWYFDIVTALTTATASSVVFADGGSACNVYWTVGSSATLGIGTSFMGTIIARASVTFNTGAVLLGRAFALSATVTLDSNVVIVPDCLASIPTSSPGGEFPAPTFTFINPASLATTSTTISILATIPATIVVSASATTSASITSSTSSFVAEPLGISSSLPFQASASRSTLSFSSSVQDYSFSPVIKTSLPTSDSSILSDVSTGLQDIVTTGVFDLVTTSNENFPRTELTLDVLPSTILATLSRETSSIATSSTSTSAFSTSSFVNPKPLTGTYVTASAPVTWSYNSAELPTTTTSLDNAIVTIVITTISTLTSCPSNYLCTGQILSWTGTSGPLSCSAQKTCTCVLPGGIHSATSSPQSPSYTCHTTYWTGTDGPTACVSGFTCSRVLSDTNTALWSEAILQASSDVIGYTHAASRPAKTSVETMLLEHIGAVSTTAPTPELSTPISSPNTSSVSSSARAAITGLFPNLLLSVIAIAMLQVL